MDKDDAVTPETTVSLASADEAEVLISGASGSTSVSISANAWTAITGSPGWYLLTLGSGSETGTLGNIEVVVQDASLCLPVRKSFFVVPANQYEAMFGTSFPLVDSSGDVTVAALSTTAKAEVNAECDTAITDAALATASALATVDMVVDDILADTNELQTDDIPTTLATIAAYIDTEISSIITTQSSHTSSLATIAAGVVTIDGIVDAILVDTAEIGTAGAGLTAVALGDVAHGGTAAVLTVERIIAESTTLNEPALKLTGNGTAAGFKTTGGATGPGLESLGGATSGAGASFSAQTEGHGIDAAAAGTARHGARFVGDGTGSGIYSQAGSSCTTGAIYAAAPGATNCDGFYGLGIGTGSGFHGAGGATGHGFEGTAGAGGNDFDGSLSSDALDLVLVDTKTLPNALEIIAAACIGIISGAGTGTEVFKGLDKTTTRASVTVDGSGNRSAITYV